MKKHIVVTCVLAALAIPAFAGTTMASKQYVEPEPEPTGGPYIALFGGANFPEDGDFEYRGVQFEGDNDTGWFAGLKLGYVFPTKYIIKPVLEIEGFYNSLDLGVKADVPGNDITAGLDVDSGVGLANAIIRAEFGPVAIYGGAGIGYYYASSDDAEISINGRRFSEDLDSDQDGLAWQALGGIEFAFNDHWAVFAEYKYLVYKEIIEDEDLNQHLVGGGVKFRF